MAKPNSLDRRPTAALRHAVHQGVNSGLAGASAMGVQVLLLMPIDSIVTYQYRYGNAVADLC
jgi:hypothetical protein